MLSLNTKIQNNLCMASGIMGKFSKATSNLSPSFVLISVGAMVIIGFITILTMKSTPGRSNPSMKSLKSVAKQFKALTWNMAAINNNPFGNFSYIIF